MASKLDPCIVLHTNKPFDAACVALKAAVVAHGFGVLAVHDLGETLRAKGIHFAEPCQVSEVCQPQQAAKVLANEMSLNMALPCPISLYTETGRTCLGMIRPTALFVALSAPAALREAALEVEHITLAIIRQAAPGS